MRQLTKYFILIMIWSIALNTFAKLPTGQWKTHLSYVEGQRLAVSENKIYCVASGSLFSYGRNDNALETYTKISGLNDVYINDIAYCELTNTLVICYKNGNIDLMSKDGVTNIPDLYLKAIYGEKTINKVDINAGIAYISTAFGILKLDIEKAEISETYKLSNDDPNGVNGVAILDETIYAATDDGLYMANLTDNNLQAFSAWSLVTSIGNQDRPIKGIITFNNHIVASQYNENDKFYYIKLLSTDTQWNELSKITVFTAFGTNGDYLLVANGVNINRFDSSFTQQTKISSYNFSELEFSTQNKININHAIPLDENTYLVADKYQGLVYYKTNGPSEYYYPKGPATNTIWDLDIVQNVLRTVHGAVLTDYYFTRTPGAISTLNTNSWSFIDSRRGVPAHPNGSDLLTIATDPLDINRYYVSAYHKGILEFYNDELIKRYDASNSTLKVVPSDPGALRSLGLVFDDNNNLWVSNCYVDEKMHRMTPEREWTSFSFPNTDDAKTIGDITIVNDAQRWAITPYWGKGIIAYDDNNTLDDTSDDQNKYFSVRSANSSGTLELVSDNVFAIEKANDGVLWVGSDNGVALYYNPSDIFETTGTPEASRINIPRNDGTGYGDYLLDGTTVNSIAVDGGNRKWLATASTGVMLVSSDGQDVVHHFTKENSPLLSNNVRQVEINQETGEVYFVTDVGLVSFQADATTGESDFSNLKVYPNPVREDFSGDITITGLIDETTVKITDVSGNLVRQTESNGGTAVWDGKNFYGERVGTGVYLIFCSDQEGIRSGMTKVLVVN